MMDLIQLLVLIAIIGLMVWAIVTYVPMPPPFKNIIVIVAVAIVIFYLLTAFNLLPANVLPRGR